MKSCTKCGISKLLKNFYRRKTGMRAGEYYEKCKECYKKRGRIYYLANRDRQSELSLLRKRKYKAERRKFIEDFKKNKACMDCKRYFPPWIMDFDHLEGQVKISSVSRMAITNTANFEKIKIEIAKCELVCANCHRQRTHVRMAKRFAEIANEVKAPL